MSRVHNHRTAGRYLAATAIVAVGAAFAWQGWGTGTPAVAPSRAASADQQTQSAQVALAPNSAIQASLGTEQAVIVDRSYAHAVTVQAPQPIIRDAGTSEPAPGKADIRIVQRSPAVASAPALGAALGPALSSDNANTARPTPPLASATASAVDDGTGSATSGSAAVDLTPTVSRRSKSASANVNKRAKPQRNAYPEPCVSFVWPGDHGPPDRWKSVCGGSTKSARKG